MDLAQVRRYLAGLTVVASGIALPAAARAQQPAAVPAAAPAAAPAVDSTSLVEHAATQARAVANRLDSVAAAGHRAPADASQAQYQNGLTQLLAGQCDAAYLLLRGAVTANPNKARNHGDLAYALACRQRPDDAATEYEAAIRLQSTNPWYYVGLAAVRVGQERWTEAGANYTLAIAVDSTILYPALINSALSTFMHTGNADQELVWARAGSQRFPSEPNAWLRLAYTLRQRGENPAEGLDAIRHFHALQPDNHLGQALFSLYLSDAGQSDSALAFAGEAVADTTLKEYVSVVFLRVGAHLLQARDFTRAAYALNRGRDLAPASSHARFSLYLGIANLQRAVPLYNEAVEKKNCTEGKMVDSVLVTVDHDLHEAMSLDSAQVTHILTDMLPPFRQKVNDFKDGCH
jgi:tetratricopeptide (TPR) repeat protein